ncbi:linear amide C-N hydrolase (choloylglycine hydrolase family) [Natranaerovirga pectinivora]|uniref:Linear amide C-N hydrolase (Choloylglycine hydrolase family) n=1 Tax=Natranaerovirga pectinivora TaxID=682400 RepID=A0A4R3MPD0_9FIRM|nr:linear amide C-N hydrolase [Natranaerovirga pectinivora]TCT17157.1 linear amide C-N hydrolase (choloylglycine hydrolase family) [Natranaerovirga pectinivora]
MSKDIRLNSNNKKKVFKRTIITTVSLILVIVLLIGVLFHNEIATIASIKKINDRPVYEMTYYGDYAFDKFLETGASSAEELELFLRKSLARGIMSIGIKENPDRGCSAFIAKTPEGDVIFARNLDYSYTVPMILETKAKSSYRSLSIANILHTENAEWINDKYEFKMTPTLRLKSLALPYLIFDGMNEHGLAVAVFALIGSKSTIEENKTTLYDTTVIRLMLDKAKNVEEAINLISQYNVAFIPKSEVHFMFADADGNSAIVEYIRGEEVVIPKEGDYQIISNFRIHENRSLQGFGSDRYLAYDAVLSESGGIITTEDALKLLQENTIPGDEQWSVVYNLTQKTVSLTIYDDYDTLYFYELD